MTPSFIQIEPYRARFYNRENDFKRFLELSEEQLSILSQNVSKRQKITMNTLSTSPKPISKLDLYQKTLQYLTSPNAYFELKTFDERMAFLIMMTDPDLVTFKEYLKLHIISPAEIDGTENKKEKKRLEQIRSETINKYETTVREKIGFIDFKLIKYEETFFKRFFNEKELITEVGYNTQDKLMIRAKLLKDFNSISDERYEELGSVAQTWLSLVPEKYNSKVAAYSVTNQKKLLGITNTTEQLALFILLIDSNLDMLRIYEEESIMKNVERRIVEEFGYFNKELLVLERKFHDRFCPDKELSIWTKTKKTLES